MMFKALNSTVLVFLLALIGATRAMAFPDTVRHGYTSCMTCHNSPGGGGTLSNYGKFIAQELYSGLNNSDDALPWLTQPDYNSTEPWQSGKQGSWNTVFGLLARGTKMRVENSEMVVDDFKRMQFDLETGLVKNKFLSFITAGFRGSSAKPGQNELDVKVRSFYAGVRDLNYAFRVGRYYPDFGIRHPHHNISTRRGLYFNQGDEPYAVQANIFIREADFALAYLEGARETALDGKKGFSAQLIGKTSHSRTGISHLNMSDADSKSSATSLHTQIGVSKDLYAYLETAVKLDVNKSGKQTQASVAYSEVGYEIRKGFIPYLMYDHNNRLTSGTRTETYGLGMRTYPFTHFEVMLQYADIQVFSSAGLDKGSMAFAMFNMYF